MDRQELGVLTEGAVQSSPSRSAAERFRDAHAVFWGRRSPLMVFDGEFLVEIDSREAGPSEPSGNRQW